MTQKEILEYNKLCAEFLGYTVRENNCYNGDNKLVAKLSFLQLKDLRFHSDWNWIMEVVKAIEKVGETNKKYGVLVDITTTYVRVGDFAVDLKNTKMSKEDATIQAIHQFLIWYNNEKIHNN